MKQSLSEIAIVFLKLGAIAFGGPAAHIAMMDKEIVEKRQWLSREKLLDLLGVTNLIPGPNSTELAIHIGYEKAGWRGLIVAGSCFILPAMAIVWLLAILYVRFESLPSSSGLLYGIKPVVIAIIIQALWKIGKKAAKDTPTTIGGVMATVAFFLGLDEILILLLIGLGVMITKTVIDNKNNLGGLFFLPFLAVSPSISFSPSGINIFLAFLKIGSILYGGGYVLLAFLQRDLVENYQWLTSEQLLDAIAVGQLTPGPIFTTATFVGYLIAGNKGAIMATIGIFLPSFILVLLVNPWVEKIRQSVQAGNFLDGVNAASLGLMAGVTYILMTNSVTDLFTLFLVIITTIVIFRYQINSVWLVLIGGLAGFLYYYLISI
ncbi:chromate transporter [Cyanobacterium aponinum AL20118]|uniref:Chromate transporter, chromate ion transporter (CHR) family n=3 Tax=Cyanobacterium aponinum TaxID=379064 RepID=K9Z1E5_CYAAP|nr:chromate transporter [Cyanobacterium aponinum]AFZ53026.1 chromate transporter, chromate ion transporter (CHR) family [Cyanobacterium aponinum PCC 10605]MTF39418.1 chromate efflux transporter [Cyanobacterium aponinum 0216]WPF90249.1 chromate transporter [Cyanobacterium aponinum AL20115]WRL38712.1 chromate transporter [Cyanobacterium aponinum UTEX 3221]